MGLPVGSSGRGMGEHKQSFVIRTHREPTPQIIDTSVYTHTGPTKDGNEGRHRPPTVVSGGVPGVDRNVKTPYQHPLTRLLGLSCSRVRRKRQKVIQGECNFRPGGRNSRWTRVTSTCSRSYSCGTAPSTVTSGVRRDHSRRPTRQGAPPSVHTRRGTVPPTTDRQE